jgi:predicted lipoprotein with Yx(FWY)xxD motif
MRHPRFTLAAIAVALAATIGGVTVASAAGSSSSHTAARMSASQSAGGAADLANPATVQTATATVQGSTETILVDAHGLPLYIYQPDTASTSHVTGQLAALWPPLLAAAPTDRGLTGRLASVATTNGKQVAYNGHFLYTFVEDRPGQVTGQGVQNFFVATPNLGAGAPSTTPLIAPKSGYGY